MAALFPNPPLFTWIILGLLAVERGIELLLNAKHVTRLRQARARFVQRDGLLPLVAVQGLLFGGSFVESAFRGRPAGLAAIAIGALLVLFAQALRYWCIRTLGDRWTIRVATIPGRPLVASGPYRYLRHPNYVAVFVESVGLPVLLGAWWTAAVVPVLTLGALWHRIRIENRALLEASRPAGADPIK